MSTRLGFVGIIVENRKDISSKINDVISSFGDIVIARLGVPYKEKECSVITLVVDTDNDTMGKFTGRLGLIKGISVKSALSKKN